MKRSAAILLIAALTLEFCSYPSNKFTGEGESATIILNNNSEYQGELVSVSENKIYLNRFTGFEPALTYVEINDIKEISIDRFSGNSLLTHGVLFQLIPGILFGIAAFAADVKDAPWVLLISSLPGIYSIVTALSTPPQEVAFSAPIDEIKIKRLRKYCRYYQELTDEQINALINNGN